MPRHNSIERIGVSKTSLVIEEDLNWIFREQPIADVGIDAIIEKSENGEPAGKFIAAQIKSGDSHFYNKNKYLSYYGITNIHYNYWLNLNLPVILIAYLPSTKTCYWQIINKKTLRKTKNKWKIDIPKTNILDSKSITKLDELVKEIKTQNVFSDFFKYDYDSEFSAELNILHDSIESININKIWIRKFSKSLSKFRNKHNDFQERGYTDKSAEIKGNIKQLSRFCLTVSQRMYNETMLFSNIFPDEFHLAEKLTYSLIKNNINTTPIEERLSSLINNWKSALTRINSLKKVIENPEIKYPTLKKSLKKLADSLDTLHTEFNEAYAIIKKLHYYICNSNPYVNKRSYK